MYCKKCGTKMKETDLFCPQCGEKVAPPAQKKAQTIPLPPKQTVNNTPTTPSGSAVSQPPAAQAQEVQPPKAKKDKKSKSGKKSKKIIAVVCALAIVAGSVSAGLYFFPKKAKGFDNLSDARFIYMDEAITDEKITDEKSAVAALGNIKSIIGVEDIHELKVKAVQHVGENTYYRFQQYIDDVPVVGRNIVVGADKEHNSTGLTANTLAVTQKQDPQEYPQAQAVAQAVEAAAQAEEDTQAQSADESNPSKEQTTKEQSTSSKPSEQAQSTAVQETTADNETLSQLSEAAHKHIAESVGTDAFSIVPKGETYSYYINEKGEAVIAYEFYVGTSETIYYTLIAAQSGEVLLCKNCLTEAAATVYGKDKSVSATGWKEADTYSLYNEEHHINVFDFKGFDTAAYNKKHNKNAEQVEELFTEYGFETISSKKNAFDTNAVKLLNLIQAMDGYYRNLGEKGFDSIHASVNDGYDKGNNARGAGITIGGERRAVVLLGKNHPPQQIDVVAHEYTHAVTDMIVNFTSSEENQMPGALNEAYSDIFGTLIEQAYCKWKAPDWQIVLRNLQDPQSKGYPVLPTDENNSEETGFAHPYSTVISHTAYLMWNGIDGNEKAKIDSAKLAQIWYNSLQWMQSDCTFSQCAAAVQIAANVMYKSGEITREQLDCVKKAFLSSQITVTPKTSKSTVKSDFTLEVLNYNGGENVTYSYKIYRLPEHAGEAQSDYASLKEVKKGTSNQSKTQLSLKAGEYLIKLADDAREQNAAIYDLRLRVDDTAAEAEDTVTVHTDFTDVITVELEAPEQQEKKDAFEKVNYGNVVSDGEKLYYWKYNADSFVKEEAIFGSYYYNKSAQNELISRDADGNESVLLTECAAGKICLANGRIYFSRIGDYSSNSYASPQQVLSCKTDGSDVQEHMQCQLLGAMEGGKYLLTKETGVDQAWYIKTMDTDTLEQTTVFEGEAESSDYLACSDKWIIYQQRVIDTTGVKNQKFEVYKMSATGADRVKIHETKVTDLSSVQSALEWNSNLVGATIQIAHPYVKDNVFYYTLEHVEGTARVVSSFNAYKIDLRDNTVTQIDTENTYREGGGTDYALIGDKEYAQFLSQKDTCVKKGDYSAFAKEDIGVYGEKPGTLCCFVYYCESIGQKQYVLLTKGQFSSHVGWRPCYQYDSCAMFEVDTETGQTTMLYATK